VAAPKAVAAANLAAFLSPSTSSKPVISPLTHLLEALHPDRQPVEPQAPILPQQGGVKGAGVRLYRQLGVRCYPKPLAQGVQDLGEEGWGD